MTEQEKINAEIQTKLALQDAKFDMFIQEMRDFKTEMRDRDNQRAEDIREIRASLDSMGKHVRNISVATIIGVATIVITVIYSILTH